VNIIIITTYQSPILTEFFKHTNTQQISNIYLTTEKWVANFESILSSTLPSHHQVWTENDLPGIHVASMPKLLAAEGFHTQYIGSNRYNSLVEKMGFQNITNDDSRVDSSILTMNGKHRFIFWCHEGESSQIISILSRKEFRSKALILVLTIPTKRANDNPSKQDENHRSPFIEELNAPLYLITNKKIGIKDSNLKKLGSIVDIFPTILGFLKIKKPYPIIGKDLKASWFGMRKSKNENGRNSIIYEHEDGSKTIITDEFKITIYFGSDHGEIYATRKDPQEKHNLWNEPSFAKYKADLFVQFLWAQLDKEVMPMPRIAGA
jgi:arylsulfatase A-like enzyme